MYAHIYVHLYICLTKKSILSNVFPGLIACVLIIPFQEKALFRGESFGIWLVFPRCGGCKVQEDKK